MGGLRRLRRLDTWALGPVGRQPPDLLVSLVVLGLALVVSAIAVLLGTWLLLPVTGYIAARTTIDAAQSIRAARQRRER